jgi:predicted aldo/keto reductase-like oxidoreductase
MNNMKKLGFGMMRLPVKDAKDQASIDQEQVNKMADYFLANGFTYVDTAWMYHDGQSEVAVRKAFIERHPRESFYLADKLPVGFLKSAEDYPKTLAQQVERLGGWDKLRYFDNYLIHGLDGTAYPTAVKFGAFEFLRGLKKEGKIRHFCLSFHDTPALLDEVLTKYPDIEMVQLQINYVDWDNEAIQSGKCYEVCVKHGKPVMVMEPVKGGSLASVPAEAARLFKAQNPTASAASWAIRYAASLENVRVVLSGMSSFEQMADNVSYMKDFAPLTDAEQATVRDVAAIITKATAIPCTGCRYCVSNEPPCPKNIPIPEIFALYNNMRQFGHLWHHSNYYQNLCRDYGAASDCIECGQCEERCPQHIEIRKWLKEAGADLADMSKITK